jgi:two-component system cell cycle response regulator CtrA
MPPRTKLSPPPDGAYELVLEADNDRLRLRVAELEREVARLSAKHEIVMLTPVAEFGFTPSEALIFARLAATGFVTNDDLMAVLTAGKTGTAPGRKIIDVYVCKIRKKLDRFDIVIETMHGRGYKIGPDSLAKVAAIQSGTEIVAAG